jgi:hypothetical protein
LTAAAILALTAASFVLGTASSAPTGAPIPCSSAHFLARRRSAAETEFAQLLEPLAVVNYGQFPLAAVPRRKSLISRRKVGMKCAPMHKPLPSYNVIV